MHVTRDDLAAVIDWVSQIRLELDHRIRHLEQKIGPLMGLVDDNRSDLASLSGAVSDIEGLLIQQETQINGLTAKVTADDAAIAEAGPEHQALLDTHTALASAVQSLRDAVTAATPAPPAVVQPAPGTTTADPASPAAPGGPLDPAGDGSSVVVAGDPANTGNTGAPVVTAPADGTVADPAVADPAVSDSAGDGVVPAPTADPALNQSAPFNGDVTGDNTVTRSDS